jgi:hypothetical protein
LIRPDFSLKSRLRHLAGSSVAAGTLRPRDVARLYNLDAL